MPVWSETSVLIHGKLGEMDTVYITYNPRSEVEQTLAVRLHTIGAVNGFKMLLPDRMYSETVLDDETTYRIDSADWFVLFLTQPISSIVQQEIDHAVASRLPAFRIIIIYYPDYPPQVVGDASGQIITVPFDPSAQSFDAVAQHVLLRISQGIRGEMETQNSQKNGLIALLGIGLGLLALNALSSTEE